LYLYNIPERTNISIEIDTVLKAAEIPGISGIKDSSGDMFYFLKLVQALENMPEFKVFVGPEEIMAPTVLFGASGGVNGGANIFPELFVTLYKAARAQDLENVLRLQDIVTQISSTLYQVGKQSPNFIKIVKCALSQMGICNEQMAGPYIPFSEKEKAEIALYLEQIRSHTNILQNVEIV
jgi:4-hydroxy-tetrahydrodipicolinate synthase